MCQNPNHKDEKFEDINRKTLPLGGTNTLLSVPADALERADPEVVFAAAEHLPEMHPKKPLEYRFAVVRQYVSYEDIGPKRADGEPFRTESQHRLDKAFTDVASACSRSESTIRAACTSAYARYDGPTGDEYREDYESDDSAGPTEEFRMDCQKILEQSRTCECHS
jgi:hypothetical protein